MALSIVDLESMSMGMGMGIGIWIYLLYSVDLEEVSRTRPHTPGHLTVPPDCSFIL
jgi:hypothetical protein